MGKVVSIFNQKGGVAKTSTVTNLGGGLATKKKKILIIDNDPQANSTNAVGIDDEGLEASLYELLIMKTVKKEDVEKAIIQTPFENLYLLPCDITLADAEQTLSNVFNRESKLKRVVDLIKDDYDYIFIDCPPSLGLLSVNALVASESIIIPVATSFFSIKGIKRLLNTYNLIKEELQPNLDIMGVLITRFRQTTKLARSMKEDLENAFGDKLFKTMIRENVEIDKAQEHQMPVIYYNNDCNGYEDYMALAEEVLNYGN